MTRQPLPDKVMRLTVKLMMKAQKFEERPDTRQRLKGAAAPSHPWEHVDCGVVVQELHHFFEYHPWQGRATDDIPTSAAKAVLRELVKARGASLAEYVNTLPAASSVRPLYDRMMRRFRPDEASTTTTTPSAATAAAAAAGASPAAGAGGAKVTTPASAGGRRTSPRSSAGSHKSASRLPRHSPRSSTATTATAKAATPPHAPATTTAATNGTSVMPPPLPPAPDAENAVEAELASIFAKLSDPKGYLKEGIEELHKFKVGELARGMCPPCGFTNVVVGNAEATPDG